MRTKQLLAPRLAGSEATVPSRGRRSLAYASLQVGVGTLAVLGGRFAAMMIAAAVLPAGSFGVMAITQSFATVIDRLFNMQSWQYVVKRGAEAHGAGDRRQLSVVVGAALLADVIGAVLALTIGAAVLLIAGAHFGISSSALPAAIVYCSIAFLNPHGVCAGILRLSGNFAAYSRYQVLSGIGVLTSVTCVAIFSQSDSSQIYLAAWIGAELVAFSVLASSAATAVRGMGCIIDRGSTVWRQGLLVLRNAFPFLGSTWLSSCLRMVTREGDVLIVGAVSGTAGAGLYKAARNLAIAPLLLTDAGYFAIYPTFAKLAASSDFRALRALLRRMLIVGVCVGLLSIAATILYGDSVLRLMSIDSAMASTVLKLYVVASAIAAATFPFAPALIATGLHRGQLVALTIATVIYLTCALPLTIISGPNGAAVAAIIFICVWVAIASLYLRKKEVL